MMFAHDRPEIFIMLGLVMIFKLFYGVRYDRFVILGIGGTNFYICWFAHCYY